MDRPLGRWAPWVIGTVVVVLIAAMIALALAIAGANSADGDGDVVTLPTATATASPAPDEVVTPAPEEVATPAPEEAAPPAAIPDETAPPVIVTPEEPAPEEPAPVKPGVKGYAVTPELCSAIAGVTAANDAAMAASQENGVTVLGDDVLAAHDALAAVPSRYQDVYASLAASLREPADGPGVTQEELDVRMAAVDAMTIDMAACG